MKHRMTRRTFIKQTSLGFTGLTLGAVVDFGCSGIEKPQVEDRPAGSEDRSRESFRVSQWLNISEDNQISIVVIKGEMGQGTSTALAMIVAEELGADWKSIEVDLQPELDPYLFPGWHATYSRLSIYDGYPIMRRVGAAAKEMLIAACANQWNVSPDSLTAENGKVFHPKRGSLSYGELARAASALEVPQNPTLKDPAHFQIIGKSFDRLNARAIVDGKPIYGIDVDVPDMVCAAVRQSPVFGGKVSNLDSLSVSETGAESLVAIPNGVAVVAKSWWQAQRVLDSLKIEFDNPPEMEALSTPEISAEIAKGLSPAEKRAELEGDPKSAMEHAVTRVTDSRYEVPFLSQSPMEPMTCTAHVTDEHCEVWAPTQYPEGILYAAMEITGLPAAAIKINTTNLGGGFGRKAEVDFAQQAITVAKSVRKPVKVIWSREEDTRHSFYRPPAQASLSAGLDDGGKIVSWIADVVGPYVFEGGGWNNWGFVNLPYVLPNREIRFDHTDHGVPVGWMRGVGYSKNTFFVESFIDELADAAQIDPLAFRLNHIEAGSPNLAVLTRAAEMADWGNPRTPGAAHGIAMMNHEGTFVAEVAEVSVESSGKVVIHRVYAAVDCGTVINPDIVKAQIEGGIVFGISTGLYGEISIANGAVEQSNFHDYPMLRLRDAPEVETSIIASTQPPSGVGEYSVPQIVPAITNAIYSLTGERVRQLPINKHGFS